MSRRDGAIVAWHEVPGTAPPQKSRPVGYGVIRAGVGTDSMIEVTEMSRRDGAIVAWHEVPGTAPPRKSRPVRYGVIRADVRTDSMIGVTKSRIQKLKNFMWYDFWPTIQFLFHGKHFLVPTGRFFRGTLSQALRARLRSVLSLRDARSDISQQHLASPVRPRFGRRFSRKDKRVPFGLVATPL